MVISDERGYTNSTWWLYHTIVVIPKIIVVITKLLCQIEFYQWLAQYDTDRCVSCFLIFLCASLKIYLKIAIMLSKFRVCMYVCMYVCHEMMQRNNSKTV